MNHFENTETYKLMINLESLAESIEIEKESDSLSERESMALKEYFKIFYGENVVPIHSN